MVWIPIENLEIPDDSIEEVKLKVTNEPVQGDILSAGPDNNFTWVAKTQTEFQLGPNPFFNLTERRTPGTKYSFTPFGDRSVSRLRVAGFLNPSRGGIQPFSSTATSTVGPGFDKECLYLFNLNPNSESFRRPIFGSMARPLGVALTGRGTFGANRSDLGILADVAIRVPTSDRRIVKYCDSDQLVYCYLSSGGGLRFFRYGRFIENITSSGLFEVTGELIHLPDTRTLFLPLGFIRDSDSFTNTPFDDFASILGYTPDVNNMRDFYSHSDGTVSLLFVNGRDEEEVVDVIKVYWGRLGYGGQDGNRNRERSTFRVISGSKISRKGAPSGIPSRAWGMDADYIYAHYPVGSANDDAPYEVYIYDRKTLNLLTTYKDNLPSNLNRYNEATPGGRFLYVKDDEGELVETGAQSSTLEFIPGSASGSILENYSVTEEKLSVDLQNKINYRLQTQIDTTPTNVSFNAGNQYTKDLAADTTFDDYDELTVMLQSGDGLLATSPINIASDFNEAGSRVNYPTGSKELVIVRVGDNRVQITSDAGDFSVAGFILRRY